MATATEGKYAGEFLVSDNGEHSRDAVTILSGQTLEAGDVVGRVKYGIGRVSIPTVVGTGTGTVSAVFAGQDVEVGNYVLTCTEAVAHGGVFSLTTPSGLRLPDLTMTPGSGGSTVYQSSHINFTITDSTDFIVGDSFTFVVSTTAPTVIGGTGTGTLSLHTLGPDAMPGNYRIINRAVVTNGGDFEVIAPDGSSVGRFLMGTGSAGTAAFTSRQVNFSLTDATDFIVGNYFDLCVFNQLNGGKVVEWDPLPSSYDGRQHVAGIAWDNYDASDGDVRGVIECRDAVVNGEELGWKSTVSAAQRAAGKAALTAMGVVVR